MGMDISIYETGNGGDAELKGNDLASSDSLFNTVYLAFFGGNPGFVTTGNELENEQRFDFWGNSLFMENNPTIQFNSLLEYTLNNTALNSEGRLLIENAAKKDLLFLSTFAEVKVSVSIVTNDNIKINVTLTELKNLQEKEFQFIWDSTKNELIDSIIL